MFKVNNRNIKKRCEICSKLTIKTPERHQWQWRPSGVFIVKFEHISDLVLLFLLSFKQVNSGYDNILDNGTIGISRWPTLTIQHLLFQSQLWKQLNHVQNMFKANKKTPGQSH